ncbi:hypothetical protein O6H91_22G064000 [Diphasiastrum complanatum]|nr:hypothetical protein O6H91_22G064000 [Diphasiastrum complanatum]
MVDNSNVTCMELLRLVEATKSRSSQSFPQAAPSLIPTNPFSDRNKKGSNPVPIGEQQHPPHRGIPHNYTSESFPVCLNSRPPEVYPGNVQPGSYTPQFVPSLHGYACSDTGLSSAIPGERFPVSGMLGKVNRSMNESRLQVSEVKKEYDSDGAIVNHKAEDGCLANGNDVRRQTLQNALLAFEQIRLDCVRQEGLWKNEPHKRADLKAGSIMKERGLWLNEQKVIGDIPGVLVGDIFNYRMQMCLVGLHRQLRAGIDYISAKDSAFNVSIATSVVICTDENYGDDLDMGDTVVYTGQGGMARGGKKLPAGTAEDQKLVRGNIALKNTFDLHVPIRLIRGHRMKNHHSGIMYRYDGLYVIYDMKYEACAAGNNVFKFLLQRMNGQPPLGLCAPFQPQQNLLTYSGSLPKENACLQGPLLEAIPNLF